MGEETIGALFQERCQKFGDRVFLRYKKDGAWRDLTWNQVNDQVKYFSLGLVALGLNPREKVALFSENRPQWVFADLGILSAAAVNVPIYATNTAAQAEFIIRDSEARFVIVSTASHLDRVLAVKKDLPQVKNIIAFDAPKDKTDPSVLTFEKVVEMGRKYAQPEIFAARIAEAKKDDLCSIVYTSGTTGDPKGAMLTHDNFLANVRATLSTVNINDQDIALSFLPLSHVLERMAGYYCILHAGATIVYAESVEKVPDNIQEIKPTLMVSVPRLYEKMYAKVLATMEAGSPIKQGIFRWSMKVGAKQGEYRLAKKPAPPLQQLKFSIADKLVFAKLKERMGGRLKFFVSGGAPLSEEIARFFYAAGLIICEGYGLTETAPVITANNPDHLKFGSVGRPIPGVEVKIAPDGEILAKGPNVMQGYFKKPEATKEVIHDGWFATGDIGFIDDDGFLHITDRKKDLIITAGGKNVAPQNIENLLKLNKYIEQVSVIGDRRAFLTALIVPSFVELENWAKGQGLKFASRDELVTLPEVNRLMEAQLETANRDLARYEQVKRFRLLPNEFSQETGELTPTLKVKRKVINQKYQALIEAMYTEGK